MYTMQIKKEDAISRGSPQISSKSSLVVCRKLNRKSFAEAKVLLEGLLEQTKSIDGKFYTKTAKEILGLLKNAEKNAVTKGLDPNAMELIISAHKGTRRYRSRRKRSFGYALKSANIQVILKKRESK